MNRFVFPTSDREYWEETMFAEEPGHFWTQPIWYRALLVDGSQLKEAHYYYHHLPFPPRGEPSAAEFYRALYHVHAVWARDLNPPMKIDVPDPSLREFCLHALLLEEITRVGDHPKYGYPPLGGINVFGGYGYNNVDTFQDTFNTSVVAFVEWGLFDVAARYIDDYFTNSVRDDGSIDTRGPEIGQYGKMLTAVAKYYAYTHDDKLLRKHENKLQAIVDLFRTAAKAIERSSLLGHYLRHHSRLVGARQLAEDRSLPLHAAPFFQQRRSRQGIPRPRRSMGRNGPKTPRRSSRKRRPRHVAGIGRDEKGHGFRHRQIDRSHPATTLCTGRGWRYSNVRKRPRVHGNARVR